MSDLGLVFMIIKEFRTENHVSPFRENEEFVQYVEEGIFSINQNCGQEVDYDKDLEARSLLKNYVLYADYKRLAEFKELYGGEYIELQAKYYKSSHIQ